MSLSSRVLVVCALALASCASPAPDASASRSDESTSRPVSFNVMGPLVVGDPRAPRAPSSEPAWAALRDELHTVKALGADAVSTDVWWGIVEGDGDQRFRWEYYDRLVDEIAEAGLGWVPILSFHQCGGNVGDECDVPIPSWLGEKYVARGAVAARDDLLYRSARGNVSREVLSAWATPIVGAEYRELMTAFQAHFTARASQIHEINVSLGPAGELRFPSYNAHDPGGGFPTRGTLQGHGRLAVEGFRAAMLERYGTVARVAEAWGAPIDRAEQIRPPEDGEAFFDRNDPFTPYGRDFIGYYQRALLAHGRAVLTAAIDVFDAEDAPFRGIDLGAKIPGVHWRIGSDRYAEVTAGLIRSEDRDAWSDERRGAGYGPIVGLFEELAAVPRGPRIVLHFTCLEMDDDPPSSTVASRAKSLVFWVGKHATSRGLSIKGENALAGTLGSGRAWDNMADALASGGYRGLTVLRLGALVHDPAARAGFRATIERFAP